MSQIFADNGKLKNKNKRIVPQKLKVTIYS